MMKEEKEDGERSWQEIVSEFSTSNWFVSSDIKQIVATSVPNLYPVRYATNISLEVIFEHPTYRSMSIYRMVLDSTTELKNLKKDLEGKLRTQPSRQIWLYKGILIPEDSTLKDRGVKENDKLMIKVSKSE